MRTAVGLAMATALAACGGGKAAAVPAVVRPTIAISVRPSATSNHSRPMHALVRTVTLQQFVEDQDRAVAQLVVSPDDTVLSSFVVFPGIDQTVTINRPANGALAVYFLFTGATGTSWKRMFDSPPATVRIELGDDAITRASWTAPAPAVDKKPAR